MTAGSAFDWTAVVVEAVLFKMYILYSFTKSWNSEKMVMERHGKVMEFPFQISVGKMGAPFFYILNPLLHKISFYHLKLKIVLAILIIPASNEDLY